MRRGVVGPLLAFLLFPTAVVAEEQRPGTGLRGGGGGASPRDYERVFASVATLDPARPPELGEREIILSVLRETTLEAESSGALRADRVETSMRLRLPGVGKRGPEYGQTWVDVFRPTYFDTLQSLSRASHVFGVWVVEQRSGRNEDEGHETRRGVKANPNHHFGLPLYAIEEADIPSWLEDAEVVTRVLREFQLSEATWARALKIRDPRLRFYTFDVVLDFTHRVGWHGPPDEVRDRLCRDALGAFPRDTEGLFLAVFTQVTNRDPRPRTARELLGDADWLVGTVGAKDDEFAADAMKLLGRLPTSVLDHRHRAAALERFLGRRHVTSGRPGVEDALRALCDADLSDSDASRVVRGLSAYARSHPLESHALGPWLRVVVRRPSRARELIAFRHADALDLVRAIEAWAADPRQEEVHDVAASLWGGAPR